MDVREYLIEERARVRVGTTLRDKYKLDRLLGVGGMAAVYAATHRNNKRFAVKVLHPELSLHADTRRRFLREGYVANSVEHPGAVAVLDDDVTDDGAAFLVMELLDGASVDLVCKANGGKLPVEAALAIAEQLLDVLAAADAHAIVHRDIKPANLFLTREGDVKVLDFGVARIREAETAGTSTHSGMTLGTPAYMAPEQAIGHSEEISGRTDVWAAGATLFALLTGRAVHQARSGPEQMVFAATRPAQPIADVIPDLPKAVCAIIDKALAFAPRDRWETAAAMRDAVRAARAEQLKESDGALAALMERVPSEHSLPVATGPIAPTAHAGPVSPKASTVAEPTPSATTNSLAGTFPAAQAASAPAPRSESRRGVAMIGALVLIAGGIAIGVVAMRGSGGASAGVSASAGAGASAGASASASAAASADASAQAEPPASVETPAKTRPAIVRVAPTPAPAASSSSRTEPTTAPSSRDSFDHQ
jgi:serine/threonine-protein kinase